MHLATVSSVLYSVYYRSLEVHLSSQLRLSTLLSILVSDRYCSKCQLIWSWLVHLLYLGVRAFRSGCRCTLYFADNRAFLHVVDSNQLNVWICVWLLLSRLLIRSMTSLCEILVANNMHPTGGISPSLASLKTGRKYQIFWREWCEVKDWLTIPAILLPAVVLVYALVCSKYIPFKTRNSVITCSSA